MGHNWVIHLTQNVSMMLKLQATSREPRALLMVFAVVQFSIFNFQFSIAQTVSGTVLSEKDGTPLPGVNVTVMGTYRGVATDAQGRFSLQQVKGTEARLVLSSIGYRTDTVSVAVPSDGLELRLSTRNYLSDEVVLTATRASASTATTYNELTKAEIKALNFGQDVPYILDQTPSVVVNSDAGAGVGYTGIRIRGSDITSINVTINGIPINDSESHGVWWVNMPDMASSMESIQIQRGVGTSTNGAAAFGASVNVSTNTLHEKPYADIVNGYGSFNTWRHTVAAGTGLIAKRFSLDARLSKISSDGYIDRATSDLKSFYISGAYRGERSLLRVNVFSGAEKTYQAWYGTPESRISGDTAAMLAYIGRNYLSSADSANLLNSGRTYNQYTYANETDNYQQDHYQVQFAHQFRHGISLNLAGHYTRGRGYYEQFRTEDELADYGLDEVISGNDTIRTTDLIRQRWLSNHFYGGIFSIEYTGHKRLSATVGGAWNQYRGQHFGEVIWARYMSNGDIRHRYYDNDALKNDLSVYAKVNYRIAKGLSAFVDVQYRNIGYTFLGQDFNEQQEIIPLQQTVNYNFINPKGGFNFQVNDRNRVYASFAMGHREPTRDDHVDSSPASRPRAERLLNTEVGYERKGRQYRVLLNFFHMHYTDQLVQTGRINDVGAYTRVNVPTSYRLGLELQWEWQIHKRLTWAANVAWSRNRIGNFTEAVDNYDTGTQDLIAHGETDIAFSPEWVGGTSLSYNPWKGLRATWTTKFVGPQYLDNTSNPDRMLKGWTTSGIRLGYTLSWRFFREVELAVQLNNIFNQLYEANGYTFSYVYGAQTTTENFYYPQAGFNYMTVLRVGF
jgi:iron complex outermembrane receptor protein